LDLTGALLESRVQKIAFDFAAVQKPLTALMNQLFQRYNKKLLEWKDPKGLRGCGFFQIENGKIIFQRGYWDKATWFGQVGLPIE
jgi:limonene-1,2-epoxide hydrolase